MELTGQASTRYTSAVWAVVADADPDARGAIERVLSAAGFLVIGCGDRLQLMVAARRVKPRLLVCAVDLALPFSGVAACRRLAREGLAPVVVLMDGQKSRSRGLALPKTWQVLRKPVRADLLLGLALWAVGDSA